MEIRTDNIVSRFDNFLLKMYDEPLESFCKQVLEELAGLLDIAAAALYLKADDSGELHFTSGYAMHADSGKPGTLQPGEGPAGQAAKTCRLVRLVCPSGCVKLRSSLATVSVQDHLFLPLAYNGEVEGVLEAAFTHPLGNHDVALTQQLAWSFGIALRNIRSNLRLVKVASQLQTANLEQDRLKMRVELQDHLQQEKQKLASILEGCVDGVLSFGPDGRISFANPSAAALMGISREELIGRPLDALFQLEVDEDSGLVAGADGLPLPTGARLEVQSADAFGQGASFLVTLTKSDMTAESLYTLFFQRITVELF